MYRDTSEDTKRKKFLLNTHIKCTIMKQRIVVTRDAIFAIFNITFLLILLLFLLLWLIMTEQLHRSAQKVWEGYIHYNYRMNICFYFCFARERTNNTKKTNNFDEFDLPTQQIKQSGGSHEWTTNERTNKQTRRHPPETNETGDWQTTAMENSLVPESIRIEPLFLFV